MFLPTQMQGTDQTWMLSKYAYSRLRSPAMTMGRSTAATARHVVNEFLRACRLADYDLSKLNFQVMDFEPRTIAVSCGINMSKPQILRVCQAGRFSPDDILEIAISYQGVKKAALNVAG